MRKGEKRYIVYGKRYARVTWNEVKDMLNKGRVFKGFVVGKEVNAIDYFQNMCDARFCVIANIERANTIMKSSGSGVYWYRLVADRKKMLSR